MSKAYTLPIAERSYYPSFSEMSLYRYQSIPFTQVRIRDTFWAHWQHVNHENSLPKQYQMCVQTGRFDALKLDWKPGCDKPMPHIYWDSDTAKWLEAACYACQIQPDVLLRAKIDEVAELFIKAQRPDGYLNSYFSVVEPDKRWKNLRDNHELYCAGHIIEAAVAHHLLTGDDKLLKTACRLADYIESIFGIEKGKIQGYCGHEEIELALVRLYKATQQPRYLKLAAYFVNQRGQRPLYFEIEAHGRDAKTSNAAVHGNTPFQTFAADNGEVRTKEYRQTHLPVREQREVVGHAVRALYLYSAMADVSALMDDEELLHACLALWENCQQRKSYITGGCGSSWFEEKFTYDFDLPNERAYCETCAAVALVMWAQRMSQFNADIRYAELLERALYNGVIVGMSLNGQRFFYQNPLASYGRHHRQEWFDCSCCPSNLSRLLGSLGGLLALQSDNAIVLNLYIASEIEFKLANDVSGILHIEGKMPWQGHMRILFSQKVQRHIPWMLKLRVPSWSCNFRAKLNGKYVRSVITDGYLAITRIWEDGDVLDLDFEEPILQLSSDPRILSNAGQFALQRGPFVYCAEGADFNTPDAVYRLVFDKEYADSLRPVFQPELLGGIVALEGTAFFEPAASLSAGAYFPLREPISTFESGKFRAIPYYAWDNRSPGPMRIWMPRSR